MDAAHIPSIPEPTASFPRREGHRIQPWIDGIPFYSRLYEAFTEARHSIWFVVSFLHRDFRFPQGELLWDVLRKAHQRGIDIKVLFWHNPHFFQTGHLLLGSDEDRALLRAAEARWQARWCRSGDRPSGHCHHHKFWLVDVGHETEIGFVGGMTWGNTTLDTPAHTQHKYGRHDICAELEGPCVRDVAEVFAAHWNRAGADPGAPPAWPSPEECDDLALPGQRMAPTSGGVPAQISRSIRPGDAGPAAGEDSIFQQYVAAFDAARRSIYIENQHPGEETLLRRLEAALQRGVEVVMVVPSMPMRAIYDERKRSWEYDPSKEPAPPRYHGTFDALSRLEPYPNFTLAALATSVTEERYKEIYVHAKICIVDGSWVTCGSANFVDLSFHRDHTELNVSWWDRQTAQGMLRALFAEHTHLPPPNGENADESTWLRELSRCAHENARRRQQQLPQKGHIYALDASTYPFPSGH